MNQNTLIIAEAGVNHNGDIKIAKKLIEVAASAGADLVKFQSFRADELATCGAQLAPYQEVADDGVQNQLEMLKKLELTIDDHKQLLEHCKRCRIGFISTAFDIDSLSLLDSLGQELFKVPSGEITNLPYLRHVGKMGKPILISSGMATLSELQEAVSVLLDSGIQPSQITALHCTSEYPAPFANVNLRAMQSIGNLLAVEVGYSDHTLGIEVAVAAVAMGATVIEKHFTLDRNLPGPDHMASLNPDQLSEMVKSIRNIESALGDGVKVPSAGELVNRDVVRRSLVAIRPISKGEILNEQNVGAKRPGIGISPMQWDAVIGTKACRDFRTDELIEL